MGYSMHEEALITIITPVYNVERYLKECIDSILAQTFQNWELLLVDDGSTDKSGEICEEYARKDSRIKVIHKPNTGQADSRNLALTLAKGDYIGFVDSDDWIDPDMYETLYEALMTHEADISICGHYMVTRSKTRPSTRLNDVILYNRIEALRLILEDREIKSYPANKLFKKTLLVEPFPASFYYEDYAVLFKWFNRAEKVVNVRTAKYYYRQRASGTCQNANSLKEYHFFLAELERYQFAMSHPDLDGEKDQFTRQFIRLAMIQAKKIALLSPSYSDFEEWRVKMIDHIKAVDVVDKRRCLNKTLRRKLKFEKKPRRLYVELRLKKRLEFWKKNKKKDFFS